MPVPRHFHPIIAFASGVISLAPLAFGQPSFQGVGADEKPLSAEELFAKTSPSVVKIVTLEHRETDHTNTPLGTGSGFLLQIGKGDGTQDHHEYKGYLVTNFHVIRGACQATVHFASGQTGNVIGIFAENRDSDIAILEITSKNHLGHPLDLHLVSRLPIGRKIFTIGSPKGLSNTLSEGLISGFREMSDRMEWVQITAPISPGSSGGPVVDATGTIIGIATASLVESQNLNFAVPAKYVKELIDSPVRGRPLWKGVCLFCEQSEAERGISAKAKSEMRREHEAKGDGQFVHSAEAYVEFLDRKAQAGDPIAIFLKARRLSLLQKKTEARRLFRLALAAR